MSRRMKILFLVFVLGTTGITIAGCEAIGDAFESTRDAID